MYSVSIVGAWTKSPGLLRIFDYLTEQRELVLALCSDGSHILLIDSTVLSDFQLSHFFDFIIVLWIVTWPWRFLYLYRGLIVVVEPRGGWIKGFNERYLVMIGWLHQTWSTNDPTTPADIIERIYRRSIFSSKDTVTLIIVWLLFCGLFETFYIGLEDWGFLVVLDILDKW